MSSETEYCILGAMVTKSIADKFSQVCYENGVKTTDLIEAFINGVVTGKTTINKETEVKEEELR